jgi:D-tyrosyl-tRNA(Tyr) deacylase
MRALIQRVSLASVTVNNQTVGEIEQGILALIGIEKTDTEKNADALLERILNYRIFDDESGKMNLSVRDVKGGLLLVSQFTLVADTKNGTRAGFSTAMPPEESKKLFSFLAQQAQEIHQPTASGIFGAYMQVNLCNDGPVTFWLTA